MTFKLKINGILKYLVVLFVILAGPTTYYVYFHSAPTHIVLLMLSILLFIRNKKIKKKNLKVAFTIIVLLVIVSIFHFDISRVNSIIIMLIKLIVICIMCSNFKKEEFATCFINLMLVELLVSFLCFVVCINGLEQTLPGYFTQRVDYTVGGVEGYYIYYLTPYYTVGWLSTGGFFGRNAGLFSEPGMHAIMLNICILYILAGFVDEYFDKRRKRIILAVFILGVLTTKSIGGYVELLLIVSFFMTRKITVNSLKKDIPIGIGLGVITLLTLFYGTVFDRLLNQSGSYVTRLNDTVGGLTLATKNVFIGMGFFTDISMDLEKLGIINMSNELVQLLIRFGFPITVLLLTLSVKGMARTFDCKGLPLFILALFLIVVISGESFFWEISILVWMFYWKTRIDDNTEPRITFRN